MWRMNEERGLAVRAEVGATRLPRDAKWLQLERRLVSEVVGFGCEIHIPSVSLDVLLASLWIRLERAASRRSYVGTKMATLDRSLYTICRWCSRPLNKFLVGICRVESL
jgi:hypothetical protein